MIRPSFITLQGSLRTSEVTLVEKELENLFSSLNMDCDCGRIHVVISAEGIWERCVRAEFRCYCGLQQEGFKMSLSEGSKSCLEAKEQESLYAAALDSSSSII